MDTSRTPQERNAHQVVAQLSPVIILLMRLFMHHEPTNQDNTTAEAADMTISFVQLLKPSTKDVAGEYDYFLPLWNEQLEARGDTRTILSSPRD